MQSHNSSFITYSISLHFTPDINAIITPAVNSIAEVTGNRFILEKRIPPHITIGAFHATKEDEPKLMQLTEEFTQNQKAGTIHFTEIGNFNDKVLFLKPEKSDFLSEINKQLHEKLLPKYEKAENGYYLPEIWFPHTTLATRLNQKQFPQAQSIAEALPLPLTAEISEIGLYQCSPFVELKKYTLI